MQNLTPIALSAYKSLQSAVATPCTDYNHYMRIKNAYDFFIRTWKITVHCETAYTMYSEYNVEATELIIKAKAVLMTTVAPVSSPQSPSSPFKALGRKASFKWCDV